MTKKEKFRSPGVTRGQLEESILLLENYVKEPKDGFKMTHAMITDVNVRTNKAVATVVLYRNSESKGEMFHGCEYRLSRLIDIIFDQKIEEE